MPYSLFYKHLAISYFFFLCHGIYKLTPLAAQSVWQWFGSIFLLCNQDLLVAMRPLELRFRHERPT